MASLAVLEKEMQNPNQQWIKKESLPWEDFCYKDHPFKDMHARKKHGKVYIFKYAAPSTTLEQRFQELAKKWKDETGGFSATVHKVGNQYYQEILRMGNSVVPFILKDLSKYNFWFLALQEITKENPVPKEDIGNTKKMREAWIEWGKQKHLI